MTVRLVIMLEASSVGPGGKMPPSTAGKMPPLRHWRRQCVAASAREQPPFLIAFRRRFQVNGCECVVKVSICFGLAAITLAVFWPVSGNEFIAFDDTDYVTENPVVQAGLTWTGLRWAFGASHASNWHPVTWLSHMADCQLFGLKPGAHHLTSLGFHIAATLLLFLALNQMTRAVWRSALVAALFAWHPLHIESVAWVAERKDVLSAFFFMLTLWAYVRHVTGGEWQVASGHGSVTSGGGEWQVADGASIFLPYSSSPAG